MNIEKRRLTKIVRRNKIRSAMMKPLLETKDLLLPEYSKEAESQLYEVTMKKRKDYDRIPVHVSLFGTLNRHTKIILV